MPRITLTRRAALVGASLIVLTFLFPPFIFKGPGTFAGFSPL